MMEKENSNRTRIVGLRFTPAEYARIERKWKATTCRKLSEYIRKYLFDRPITTNYRNQSLDEFMFEIIRLRTELKALGNNFNQAVKKLHTLQQIPEFKTWIVNHELDRRVLFNKVEEINKYIEKISRKWLQ
ncbi:plasmid mobilization protein [Flavobacterium collinsii]|uniref:Type IV secretory system conjugative DNA transfer relaxosome MobC family protein n=1 Tax=Flavobacterium collinsii TaxID=1114861 RepID=A0A9W4X4L6_9FLAO|nr:plasmid mobilization relaxosome protein MobC [Flavobacterium collinsii]CAI2768599.1 Type IV secretory system conjugative DNA transfer relaxosome MobC family protein [Flavobacterium collinsii]